jgi:hypothetical protein
VTSYGLFADENIQEGLERFILVTAQMKRDGSVNDRRTI